MVDSGSTSTGIGYKLQHTDAKMNLITLVLYNSLNHGAWTWPARVIGE